MDELEYITANALMMCDQGAAPDFFKPTFNTHIKIHGCLVSTKVDFTPLVNIPSFKICMVTQKPCLPATTMPWEKTWAVKILGQQTLIGRSKCRCTAGGTIEFMTSGQIPLPDDAQTEVEAMQQQAQQELDDAGHGDSVGEAGFLEGMIPIWGSGRDMINDIQTGDVGGAILNAGFLVWDVASIAVGIFSFGTGTAAMQGAKAGLKGTIKAGMKAISKKTLQGLGKMGFKKLSKKALKNSIDDVAKKLLKTCVFACFPAGTPIHTEFGIKNIEEIKVDDKVWSYNEETGETGLKEVIETIVREADVTLKLKIGDEVIETSAEHPFFTQDGWKIAAELEVTDTVSRKNNTPEKINAVEYDYNPKKVFSFAVKDWQTYFVGQSSLLVHNRCVSSSIKKIAETWEDLARFVHCFVAGTLVKTPKGNILIELIESGMEVYTYNIATKQVVVNKVKTLYKSYTDNLIKLYIDSDIICCTKNHRFWIEEECDWIEAEQLTAGMGLLSILGDVVFITNIEYIRQEVVTYNFEVEDEHNYFVSGIGILVHNKFESSIFNNLDAVETEIYGIFDNTIKKYIYVGKTVQGVDTRWIQHIKDKMIKNPNRYRRRVLAFGNWNAFQTAAREQHYIMNLGTLEMKVGAEFRNKINALSKAKFEWFKKIIKCP
ncbi:MAG: DUF4280 domain-containing protein [Dysgonamonadaceae bacterium]|jgi:hypothetical protein|nr:DUF4280 domain-containing protein [Dysgonamonadaceae bacterium]